MAENGVSPSACEAVVTGKSPLSGKTFELTLCRPAGFDFFPGQKVEVGIAGLVREYTIVSAPTDKQLALCIRQLF